MSPFENYESYVETKLWRKYHEGNTCYKEARDMTLVAAWI